MGRQVARFGVTWAAARSAWRLCGSAWQRLRRSPLARLPAGASPGESGVTRLEEQLERVCFEYGLEQYSANI